MKHFVAGKGRTQLEIQNVGCIWHKTSRKHCQSQGALMMWKSVRTAIQQNILFDTLQKADGNGDAQHVMAEIGC